MTLLRLLITFLLTLTITQPATAGNQVCDRFWVTGYVSGPDAPNATTADGTPIWTDEPIAAAPYWVPFGATISLDGLGSYRAADRGRLGERHVDVRVWSVAEAYAITGTYSGCVAW